MIYMATTLKPTVYTQTSTSHYEVGLIVEFSDRDENHAMCSVEVTPCLRNTDASSSRYPRYRHDWTVSFAEEHSLVKKYSCVLPDDNSEAGVVSAGWLGMIKDRWYRWGPTYTFTFRNDGQKHYVGVYLECTETIPKQCPAQGKWLEYSFNTATYKIAAETPKNVRHRFSESRILTYMWDRPEGTQYTVIDRTMLKADGTTIPKARFPYEIRIVDYSASEEIPIDVVRVDYEVYHVSATGHKGTVVKKSADTPSDCKVWVKVNGVWKKAVPWVKVNGVWKKATKSYVKVNGAWERTIM